MEAKPLQPLNSGVIVVVGAKASNFDDELRNHPRMIMWNSQNESWTNKDLPSNCRAVFFTRFVGHAAFGKIMSDARKRNITVFNMSGTGEIVKSARELLGLAKTTQKEQETIVTKETEEEKKSLGRGKLNPLLPLIDFHKSNVENARLMMVKAKELDIDTTEASLANTVAVQRRKQSGTTAVPRSIQPKLDVTVEILDNLIKELGDMRDFLIATVEENRLLKAKVEKFKKLFDE